MRTKVHDRVDELRKRLQAAHPRLILRVKNTNDLEYENTPSIREIDPGWNWRRHIACSLVAMWLNRLSKAN